MNTTPQGWYRDPADQSRVRWFDGQAWTASSRPAPEPGSAPLPPPAADATGAAAQARARTAVATMPARADSVPTPHPPVPMVIPLLEPDEPDEWDDYEDEPVAEPATPEPEPEAPEPVAPQPVAPQYVAPAELPPYVQPQPGQGYAPAPVGPQHFLPPGGAAPYGAAYAPSQPEELPPYVAQSPAMPFGQAPAAYAPPTAGYAPPQAAYGPPPAGYAAPGPGFGQAGPGWPGTQPWAEEPAKKNTGKIVLIVLASVLVGMVMLGILASIAIPVFLNQRAKSTATGLDGVTCEQVADYAVQVSAAGQSQGAGPLVSMTAVTLIQDNRGTVKVPSAGSDPAFVLSCSGTGTKPDGTTAPVTANLYIDSTTQQLVAYAWDQ
ncbi:DUF2510 domain-containing protein [Cellulomonas sp. McL0617]|uniref:DUF2510 domain-containing protein n=1 Tax=Cellulomonas sp. McL0617 TaxID=3415675 RepID=UPI003CF1808C